MIITHVRTTLIFVLILVINPVQAISLLDAYHAALENDPIFRAATHENDAGLQDEKIGLAGLLPNLSISHTHTESTSKQNFGPNPQTGNPTPDQNINFTSKVSSLTLRQPILNLEAVADYRQGQAQSNSSRARFAGQSQELIIRLTEAYFQTLLAEHQFRLAEAQLDSLTELKRVNEQMLLKGEGTTTDVLETQSRHALAQARVIETQDEYQVVQFQLESMIGMEITQLHQLSNLFKADTLYLPNYDDWRTIALDRNAELVTQRHVLKSTKEEIRKSHAGHAPRVDLVASLSRNRSASFITFDRQADIASIGVEINLPLYAGGRVNAITDQAKANHARAAAELDAAIDTVLLELRRQYRLVLSSIKRIESLELAVKSAKLLVDATEKSIKGGIRINLDLLDAQEQLFNSEVDLAEAKYNFLLAYLRLGFTAGTLVLDDLRTIATLFVPQNLVLE